MENKKEFNNEMLKRLEISFEITSDNNPSFSEMKKLVSDKLKKSEDCIDVYNILGKFGSKKFLIKAYIYEKPEILIEIKNLTKPKKKRDAEKKAILDAKKADDEAKKSEVEGKTTEKEKLVEEVKETKEDKPAEEKKDDKPTEEKKDDKPAEEKKE